MGFFFLQIAVFVCLCLLFGFIYKYTGKYKYDVLLAILLGGVLFLCWLMLKGTDQLALLVIMFAMVSIAVIIKRIRMDRKH